MKLSYITRTILLSLVFNISLCPVIISQQNVVDKYIKTIDSLNSTFNNILKKTNHQGHDPLKVHIQKMDLNELKHIASLMYRATDSDYIAISNTGFKRFEQLKKNGQKINGKYSLIGTSYYFQGQFKTSLSPVIYALTRVAYFLHVRVTNVKTIIPKGEALIKSEASIIDADIEDVYKGKGKFQPGDHVQFFYYEFWHKKRTKFEEGKEYFVPLEPRGKYPNMDSIMVLVPYLDDSNGFYPINDSYITDKYNYFRFGERIPFYIFELKLRNKIGELESW